MSGSLSAILPLPAVMLNLLKQVHWLPALKLKACIDYKTACLCCTCKYNTNSCTPSYLSDLHLYSPSRSLRSTSDFCSNWCFFYHMYLTSYVKIEIRPFLILFLNCNLSHYSKASSMRRMIYLFIEGSRTGSPQGFSLNQILHLQSQVRYNIFFKCTFYKHKSNKTYNYKHNPKVSLFSTVVVKKLQIKLGDAGTIDCFGLFVCFIA